MAFHQTPCTSVTFDREIHTCMPTIHSAHAMPQSQKPYSIMRADMSSTTHRYPTFACASAFLSSRDTIIPVQPPCLMGKQRNEHDQRSHHNYFNRPQIHSVTSVKMYSSSSTSTQSHQPFFLNITQPGTHYIWLLKQCLW